MRVVSLVAGLAVGVLPFLQPNLKASTGGSSKFDGSWTVTANFHRYKDPTGPVASAFIIQFPATVTNGVLSGEWKARNGAWMTLSGKIGADGMAVLHVNGLTSTALEYHLKDHVTGESHARAGHPIAFDVKAQFSGQRGSGERIGARATDFDFVKG
ncbi:MAG: hypothetical protein JOZ08_03720 [Verrucomicrobia bacterium]|nr:hypothetical protein [Verrucomicrobiota bacterium]MBV8273975.1 hypothetical protein [Verrucomicrobiota bacterium]